MFLSDLDPAPERYVVVVVGLVIVAADDLHLAAGHALREAAVEDGDEGGKVGGAVVEVAGRQEVPELQRRTRHNVG